MKWLALITGVGSGTGSALARRFHAGGYRVAMMARTANRLAELERELPGSFAVPCDVAGANALSDALTRIETEAEAPPKVPVHNAIDGAWGNFLEIEPRILERNVQVNVMALLQLTRWATPKMEAAPRRTCGLPAAWFGSKTSALPISRPGIILHRPDVPGA